MLPVGALPVLPVLSCGARGPPVRGGAQTIREGPCPPGPIAGYGPDEYNSERILKIDQYLTKL